MRVATTYVIRREHELNPAHYEGRDDLLQAEVELHREPDYAFEAIMFALEVDHDLAHYVQELDSQTSSGLHQKFIVSRSDGAEFDPESKHYGGCRTFTLDLDHDPYAIAAIAAYADACRHDYPELASDLMEMIPHETETPS